MPPGFVDLVCAPRGLGYLGCAETKKNTTLRGPPFRTSVTPGQKSGQNDGRLSETSSRDSCSEPFLGSNAAAAAAAAAALLPRSSVSVELPQAWYLNFSSNPPAVRAEKTNHRRRYPR